MAANVSAACCAFFIVRLYVADSSSYLSSAAFVAFTVIVPAFFNVITGNVTSSTDA